MMTMNTLTDPKDNAAMAEMVQIYGKDCLGPILFQLADMVIQAAMEACKESVIAFPDMLYGPLYHECEFPKYDIILCDEFQDFNAAQLELIDRFRHKDTIVGGFGDHKQSIMMFTGAMSDSVERFTEKFNCRTMPLSVCYRCPTKVLDLARIIVPWIKDRDNCPEGIVEVIETKEGIATQAQAGDYILCRLTAPLVSMCLECIKLRKPAKVKGKEIGVRIVKMYEEVLETCLVPPFTCEDYMGELKTFHEAELARLMAKKASSYRVDLFTDTSACLKVIAEYISVESRNTHARNHHSQIKAEIDKLFGKDEDMNENPNKYITLSTVHKAKGLEADNVFILEIDKMPFTPKNKPQSTEARQQESNILYVALTRPKEALYVHGENIRTHEDLVNHVKKCEYIEPIVELEVIS
jgi:DNA helicase-2/ATP-dependent DNA helicase PcrA